MGGSFGCRIHTCDIVAVSDDGHQARVQISRGKDRVTYACRIAVSRFFVAQRRDSSASSFLSAARSPPGSTMPTDSS
jgi:hypothetical protein